MRVVFNYNIKMNDYNFYHENSMFEYTLYLNSPKNINSKDN